MKRITQTTLLLMIASGAAVAWADINPKMFSNLFKPTRAPIQSLILAEQVPVRRFVMEHKKVLLADSRPVPLLPREVLSPRMVDVPPIQVVQQVEPLVQQQKVLPKPWNRVMVETVSIRSFGSNLTIRECDSAVKETFNTDLPVILECQAQDSKQIYVAKIRTSDNDYQSRKLQWSEE